MRCRKCHNEVETGKIVCGNCRKKTPSRKKSKSKRRVTRRNERLEKNGVEIIPKVEATISNSEEKNVQLKGSQEQTEVVKDIQIQKNVDEPIKKVKNRKIVLFKGLLLFLFGVAIGIIGTINMSQKHAGEKIAVTVETIEAPNETEQTESLLKTSMEQTKVSQKEEDIHETEEKEVKKKKGSSFMKELPNKIVENVKGLKGYYSYYLHDLSEPNGVSGSSKKMLSASTIKLFILENAFFQVKADKLVLDEPYELLEEDKVPGTGDIQNAEEGTVYTTEELLNLMIIDSDNTATNVIIDRLGGIEEISDYILDRGYRDTILARKMGDTTAISEGKDNYTSVDDVGELMTKLAEKKLIGEEEDRQMLEILSKGKNHDKLANSISDKMKIYCKSGEYSDFGVQNDTLLVEGPEGSYILTVMSENGDESEQISILQTIGKEAYELMLKR